MNMQTIVYLRLIGLAECLLGVLLVALIFLAQRMKAKLAELARKAKEARRGGAGHEKRAD